MDALNPIPPPFGTKYLLFFMVTGADTYRPGCPDSIPIDEKLLPNMVIESESHLFI